MPDDNVAVSSAAPTATAPADSTQSLSATPAIEASESDTPAVATVDQGPIPFDRHKSILDKAYKERDTSRQEFEQYRQQYGWASNVDRDELDQVTRWSRGYREDPVRWMADTMSELRQTYPHLTPALTSEAARILAGSRGAQAQEEPDIEPDIPVLDAQGQQVSQAFSADQVKSLITRAVTDASKPFNEYLSQQQQAAQANAQQQAVTQEATSLWERAQTWHGFKGNEKAIESAFRSNPSWTLHDAYIAVLHSDILPKFDQNSQGTLLKQLQTNAAGASVSPDTLTSTQPPKFNNFREAAEYFEQHPEEAATMAAR